MASKRRTLSKSKRFEVLYRDNSRCQYCGAKPPNCALVIDHIHPVSNGGDNAVANLVTSCVECNYGKSDQELEDDCTTKNPSLEYLEHILSGIRVELTEDEMMTISKTCNHISSWREEMEVAMEARYYESRKLGEA